MATSPTTHNPAQPGDFIAPVLENAPEDEKLLDRIRTRFRYMERRFQKIREAGDRDMQALGPDGPWDPEERAARKKAKRPCIHLDQLNQYPTTTVNQFRMNPIGVRVKPAGSASNDQTATLRGDRIRAIEFESNAPEAYETALRCVCERGYGVITLETEEIAWDSWDQRIKIVREPDPNAVLWDPDAKEADSSDIQDGFKLFQLPVDEFKRRFPDSQITDQNLGDCQFQAPEWINVERQTVQVAKYSYFESTPRYLYLLDDGSATGRKVFKDELPPGAKASGGMMTFADGHNEPILKQKKAIQKSVQQCLTNGVEILERTDWAGQWIPIFPMIGKEKYIRMDGVTERILESQIRNAIDGQRGFDAAKTNEVECANMVPKATYFLYEGQEDTATDWENINKIPAPFALVKPIVDGATGAVLPPPVRIDWNPQIEPMEAMAEAYRRAIMSAIGSHGFTITDDTNVKSGKAVNALKAQNDTGSANFAENANNTIRHLLRAINDLLDKVEDTPRNVGIQKEDGTHDTARINEPVQHPKTGVVSEQRYTPLDPETGEPATDAEHQILIDTGPSFATQRDEASDFVMNLMQNPAYGPRVADLAVRWRDLGPYGDQMAERLTLPQFQQAPGQEQVPPQIQQAMGQLHQQNQQLTQTVQQLLQEREAKKVEQDAKVAIAQLQANMQIAIQQMKDATSIAVAGITQKGQLLQTHEELTSEENLAIASQRHDVAQMQLEQQNATQQLAQEHAQGLEAQQQATDQVMAQQDQQNQAAMDQQAQAPPAAAATPESTQGA